MCIGITISSSPLSIYVLECVQTNNQICFEKVMVLAYANISNVAPYILSDIWSPYIGFMHTVYIASAFT